MDPSGCNMESRLKLGTRLEADLRWAVIAVILGREGNGDRDLFIGQMGGAYSALYYPLALYHCSAHWLDLWLRGIQHWHVFPRGLSLASQVHFAWVQGLWEVLGIDTSIGAALSQ